MRNTKKNQIASAIITDNTVTVDISTPTHPNTYMECDLEDFISWRDEPSYGRIRAYQNAHNNYPYAYFMMNLHGEQTGLYFHRMIHPEFKVIDHKDRVGINNCRPNLRDGTECNTWNTSTRKDNTSGYTGVSFRKDIKKWIAQICFHGKNECLDYFTTPELASEAYQTAKAKFHNLNN